MSSNGHHLQPAGPPGEPPPNMLPNAGLMPVPVAPVPVNLSWGQVQVGPNVMILLTVQTPSGVQSYFIDPDTAGRIGAALQTLGAAGQVLIADQLPPPPLSS